MIKNSSDEQRTGSTPPRRELILPVPWNDDTSKNDKRNWVTVYPAPILLSDEESPRNRQDKFPTGGAGVSFTDMCYPNAAVGGFPQALRASSPFANRGACPSS